MVSDLIQATAWSWGAYVDRLEDGWLKSAEAKRAGIDGGPPVDWAEETHKSAPIVWNSRPADNVLDDRYFRDVLPTSTGSLAWRGFALPSS